MRTRFTRRRGGRELGGRSARSCRACNDTCPGLYAPAVPASVGRLLPGSRLRRRPALPASAGVVRRRRALLFVVVDPLDFGLSVGWKLFLNRVEDGLVLRAGRLGKDLRRVALVLAVGLAQSIERVCEVADRVGVLLRRGRRGRWP